MDCTKCRQFEEYLHGPYPSCGDHNAPLFLLAQNPPANTKLACKGAFRLFEAGITLSRVEQPIHDLLAKLDLDVFATQAFKCATIRNKASNRMLHNCSEHLVNDLKSSSAVLFLVVSKTAWKVLQPKISHLVKISSQCIGYSGNARLSVDSYSGALYNLERRFIVAPHPSLVNRFFTQADWERAIVEAAR